MSSGQKPRTPRYFPRMKVRGARRKWKRTMFAIQRLGDVAGAAAIAVTGIGAAFVRVQDAINRLHEQQETINALYAPFMEQPDYADLGTSIMKEDHGAR